MCGPLPRHHGRGVQAGGECPARLGRGIVDRPPVAQDAARVARRLPREGGRRVAGQAVLARLAGVGHQSVELGCRGRIDVAAHHGQGRACPEMHERAGGEHPELVLAVHPRGLEGQRRARGRRAGAAPGAVEVEPVEVVLIGRTDRVEPDPVAQASRPAAHGDRDRGADVDLARPQAHGRRRDRAARRSSPSRPAGWPGRWS